MTLGCLWQPLFTAVVMRITHVTPLTHCPHCKGGFIHVVIRQRIFFRNGDYKFSCSNSIFVPFLWSFSFCVIILSERYLCFCVCFCVWVSVHVCVCICVCVHMCMFWHVHIPSDIHRISYSINILSTTEVELYIPQYGLAGKRPPWGDVKQNQLRYGWRRNHKPIPL